MAEQNEPRDTKTSQEENSTEKKSSFMSSKTGKTFLLAGIVFVQALAAYALINSYYPTITKFASSHQSDDYFYYEFKNVVVNTAGTRETHFLVLDLSVKTDDTKALEVLKQKKDEVKDRINTLMSRHTQAELKSLKQREVIKKELSKAINKVTGKKMVRNLFFTKYVLQ